MKTILVNDIPAAPYPSDSTFNFKDNSRDAVRFASANKPMPIIKPSKKGKKK